MMHGELVGRHGVRSEERRDAGESASLASTLGLSRTERLLLCLRYADGLNDEEISVLTRSSVAEVKVALTNLVERVRAHLAQR